LIKLAHWSLIDPEFLLRVIRFVSDWSSLVLGDLARSSMTAHWMWLGLVEFAWIAHSTGT
jgi:hypothetical protein